MKVRRAFGQPIGTFQHARFTLADLRVRLDAVQTFFDQCVLLHNGRALTPEDAAAAKLLASETAGQVVDACLQLHGGAGHMDEYRISRL